MIKIKYGKKYGDSTAEYLIKTDNITVKDFINEWLTTQKDEWGYFGIKSKDGATFGNPNCEYEYGKITTKPIPSEFLNSKFKHVYGSGGWSRSDFQFEI